MFVCYGYVNDRSCEFGRARKETACGKNRFGRTGFWRFFVGFFYWHSCFLQSFDVFESAFIITYCSCSDSHLFCPSISLSESSVQ